MEWKEEILKHHHVDEPGPELHFDKVHASRILVIASAHLVHPSLPLLCAPFQTINVHKVQCRLDCIMGTLDDWASVRWLGGFGGMLSRGNFLKLSLLSGWKCFRNFPNVTPAVKPRNFHDMTPPKNANYLKMAPHKLPVSRKWPPPPSKTAGPPSQVINNHPLAIHYPSEVSLAALAFASFGRHHSLILTSICPCPFNNPYWPPFVISPL